ncbi:MAG: RING finger protein [Pirellulaceae bacterium]
MEVFVVLLLILVLALAAMGAFVGSASSRSGRWNQALAGITQRFHGHLTRGGWFADPSVSLLYGSAHVRLTCYKLRGSSGGMVAQLVIQQPEIRCRGEIVSRPSRFHLGHDTRGLAEVELDWGNQFARWQVLAANYDETRHLMSDAVRLSLDRLWLHPLPTDVAVSLLPGWLVVRKVWNEPRTSDLAGFVELVCALNDQFQLAGAAGIEFVTSDEAQVIDDALCCVCCETLHSDIVFCARCKTPHHRECWEYSGGCSTYGCGGRMHFTPGEAPLVLPAPHWQAAASHARPLRPR